MTTTPKALPALPECYVISGGRELFSAEQMHAYAQQAIADSLASAGGVEVVAYLVSGGRIFKDQAVTHKDSARTRIAERKDGSVAHPLVKQSDYLAALSKEREVADGLRAELEAVKRDAKAISQAEVSKAARFISDRSAKEYGVDKDDLWELHGSEYIEDTTDMLKHIGFAIEPAKEG